MLFGCTNSGVRIFEQFISHLDVLSLGRGESENKSPRGLKRAPVHNGGVLHWDHQYVLHVQGFQGVGGNRRVTLWALCSPLFLKWQGLILQIFVKTGERTPTWARMKRSPNFSFDRHSSTWVVPHFPSPHSADDF